MAAAEFLQRRYPLGIKNMSLQDFFCWVCFGLGPPFVADKKEMRWRIVVSVFSGACTATVVIVAIIFFSRTNFVQIDVAHASDVSAQSQALQSMTASMTELKRDNQIFRRSQVGTQIDATVHKVCKLIQALKLPNASPLLGDALATQQQILEGQKDQYEKLGGVYQDEPCDIVLLSGN